MVFELLLSGTCTPTCELLGAGLTGAGTGGKALLWAGPGAQAVSCRPVPAVCDSPCSFLRPRKSLCLHVPALTHHTRGHCRRGHGSLGHDVGLVLVGSSNINEKWSLLEEESGLQAQPRGDLLPRLGSPRPPWKGSQASEKLLHGLL